MRVARRATPAERTAPDTIVALATPAGRGAIGVVRISGPAAVALAAPLIAASRPLSDLPSHTLVRVALVDPLGGGRLDDALCAVMRGPRSYTGDDVVELSCHGSPALLRVVVERLVERGARLADPGEFTRRAFLNGRLDLAQAEAVAALIAARTTRAVLQAARALAGGLSQPVRAARERLLDVVAALEVALDFPDDGVGLQPAEAAAAVATVVAALRRELDRARRGRVVQDGVTVAIVGPPNAGKSSLLNALLGSERAIVSPQAGTTRDVVEATIVLDGVPVRLLDTAGLGAARGVVDAEGMRRARAAAGTSDLVLVVGDGSLPPPWAVLEETAAASSRVLVRAKADLEVDAGWRDLSDAVAVSARDGFGLDRLTTRMALAVRRLAGDDGDEGAIVATLRQQEQLTRCVAALERALGALAHAPLEIALVDLREALGASATLLGMDVGDEVLDRVFASFCVGK